MIETSPTATDFTDIEMRLFAWDEAETTRTADRFVRGEVRGAMAPRRRELGDRPALPQRIPAVPGSYARMGGETIVVRSNDAALALVRRARAA